MPIESSRHFIISFRVNEVFYYHSAAEWEKKLKLLFAEIEYGIRNIKFSILTNINFD